MKLSNYSKTHRHYQTLDVTTAIASGFLDTCHRADDFVGPLLSS